MTVMEIMNAVRLQHGYYTVDELCETICRNNTVFDPASVLISKNIAVGSGNIFYSGVIIHADNSSLISVGKGNIFSGNLQLQAEDGGQILIGNHNLFDQGPVCVKSGKSGSIVFEDNGRYDGRISVFGTCRFGTGSQILGTIRVYDCILQAGGDHSEPDPDNRAGVIKGLGTARGLSVQAGMVINGFGEFCQEAMEPQSNYHKKERPSG